MLTIPAKTILSGYQKNGWFGTDYNMNLYRGCCHGCIYCDSRSDCYQIDHFDTVRSKENALFLLRDELSRKIKSGVVMTGSMSDPYNPFEKGKQLTRHALELLNAYGFGAAIATKSDGIIRDIDVLRDIADHSPVLCQLTITTCDDALAAQLEPHAPSPSARLEAIRRLSQAGLFSGILLMPVLPFLEDTDENILTLTERAAEAGVRFIYPSFGVTLRGKQRQYFYDRLDELFPGIRERYAAQYGNCYSCPSPRSRKLWSVFTKKCRDLGLLYRMQDIVSAYRQGYDAEQLHLF